MDGVRSIYIANSREEALALADQGVIGYAWRTFWGHYGFYEAFRLPGQEGEIPWTLDSMERAHYLYVGTVDEIKRKLVEMVEACNPSYLVLLIDHSGSMRVGKRLGSLLRCAGFDRITMSASYQYVGTPEHRYLVSEMTARLCEEAAFMD